MQSSCYGRLPATFQPIKIIMIIKPCLATTGERIRIVDRQSITVKLPIHRSDTHFGRVRARIRASFRARKTPISRFRAHKTPISSVAALGIVRNASLFRRAGGASTSAQGQQPVYIVGRSYTYRRSILDALSSVDRPFIHVGKQARGRVSLATHNTDRAHGVSASRQPA